MRGALDITGDARGRGLGMIVELNGRVDERATTHIGVATASPTSGRRFHLKTGITNQAARCPQCANSARCWVSASGRDWQCDDF